MCKYSGVVFPTARRCARIVFSMSPIWRSGWMVPTSLFAYMTLTSTVASVMFWRRLSTSTLPCSVVSATEQLNCCAGASTDSCSMPLTVTEQFGKRAITPAIARLFPSVPPAVKITSVGRTPNQCATRALAASRSSLACRAGKYVAEGL